MSTVFIVVAGVDYEGSTPIRAFPAKYEADEFARKCREYEQTKPRFNYYADSDEIEAWSAADKAWTAAHPAGENGHGSDYFSVIEVPFEQEQAA